ncbi:PAS domain-containing hybrid sensor histidine kinase/response regulator [uncultured Holdemanella sp.]|uniref:PAS domain-containing hybrid sensor histidine kinase/response regulator n=1 Tax=uncultured Holdemanella sp. TaxID=1763549 RepID=UPI00258EF6EC|nr:PAS domain-containing hybrid sensor histidine kinase/response regulator [uncultured Holdemanella sp.]
MKIIDNDLTIQEVCGRIGGYHRCSLEEGYPFLYVSLKFQEIFGWSKEEIETRFDNKLMNMVHPEDREIDLFNSVFRLLGKDGYHYVSESVEKEGNSILHGHISDVTEFIREKEQNNILSALTMDYTSLVLCDLKQDTVEVIKQDASCAEMNWHTYSESLNYFYDNVLMKDSCPNYMDLLSNASLMRTLKEQGSLEWHFQIVPDENGISNLGARAVFLYEDLNHFKIIMGFRPIDEIVKREKVLELQREIIEGLGKEYFSVLLLELDSGQIFSYREVGENGKRIADFCRKYGNQWCELLPAYADEIVTDESRENFLDQLSLDALCSNQDDFSMTYEFKTGDRIIYHQTRIAYVYKKDRSRVAVIGTRNIDDLIKKERMQEAKLKEAYIVAEEANKAKTDFLNNMSHDIRTPMNVILGYNELMKQYLTDPILVDYQNKIEQSGKLLLSIINNVLDMARIESGKMVVEERAEQIGLVVEEIESVFESSAQEKNIVFTTSVDVDHTHVLWDGFKIREILMNLVGNAFKYTPDGGHIAIDVKELDCARSGYVRIQTQVKDTGIGMSEDYLPTLFDSFSREYNTTIGKVSGTGLGMAIVKNLVDMMDGEIRVKSKLGEGTCFTLTFEHRIADEDSIEWNQELDVLDEKSILEGKRVLLVEDNELNAEIAMAILEQSGLILDRVEDGLACINRLSEVDEDFYDLILMDIQMPNMNGYEATRRIRQFENVKKASIPILAMTANAFEEDKKMAMEAGMNGHISKPIDVNVLEKQIINIFKKVS